MEGGWSPTVPPPFCCAWPGLQEIPVTYRPLRSRFRFAFYRDLGGQSPPLALFHPEGDSQSHRAAANGHVGNVEDRPVHKPEVDGADKIHHASISPHTVDEVPQGPCEDK